MGLVVKVSHKVNVIRINYIVTQLTLYLDQKGFRRCVLFNQPSP